MKTIAEAVAELSGTNRSVLCLDTCVFLDLITTGNRGQADLIGVARKLLKAIDTPPEKLQLVVTELIVHEWDQRKNDVVEEALKWLRDTDRNLQQIHRAWMELDKPLPYRAPTYFDPTLTDELTRLAQSLLSAAIVLWEDIECVNRALGRVKAKIRPSHSGQIKDSIHLEHFLEFSRRMVSAGHASNRLFVSTNSSDFWEDKTTPTRPHATFAADFANAGLVFFGKLPLALKYLGILI